ncbi:MAG: pyridoxamine 5'-phosphate oxidase [Candidatus Eisenbacteria bacterium]|uniref:Pyridoxamine 5'-phosphate oxidase n=1 Tax=Eiseniibacteriota bacterium TaxID=2212470 RepID=A0A538T6C2_UNCEI|nr:MAG: pyridoxamine 5'-phosphate oxidase [Candidatus Eisenbacteria bacterium]
MTEAPDPIALFREWAALARRPDILEPDAAALATVGPDGKPSVRMVLVRAVDDRGFVFYTNLGSRKGSELLSGGGEGAPAALCFWWPPLAKQVRVEGTARTVSDAEADEYWAGRARDSQVGAWASRQSAELPGGRGELTARFAELDRSLPEKVPRPRFWSGFRIEPRRIEFWEGRPMRLHHRVLYTREGRGWAAKILSP